MRILLAVILLASTIPTFAEDPMCATSASNDARVRARHEQFAIRGRLQENALAAPAVREGAFYLPVDDRVAPGYRPVDLEGQSIVFEPRGPRYAIRRVPLQWTEPSVPPLRDFQISNESHYVRYDVDGTSPVLFGQSVATLYLSAYNAISLTPPPPQRALQFDDLEAAVARETLLSPLMITQAKPSRLAFPKVFVQRDAGKVIVTWRSDAGVSFGYDVQAELRADGSFVFSYRTLRNMKWGALVVSRGFDPASAVVRSLGAIDDAKGDLVAGTYSLSLADVNDIRRLEISRVGESDLLSIRLTLAAPIVPSSLAQDQTLRYVVQIGGAQGWLDVTRSGYSFTPFHSPRAVQDGAEVRFDGSTIELYMVQTPADAAWGGVIRAWALAPVSGRTIDFAGGNVSIDVPLNRIATDISAVADGTELPLPIAEPFKLGDFDPYAVWERLQAAYGLSSYDIDAVAMYQTFFTDLIFYAGAYSTGGNPAVDGIAPPSTTRGSKAFRAPSLLHMNQLTYGWNATERNSSNVMLHELGHRWLYFFRIVEGTQFVRALNPTSAHPAGFVHTPAAFRVWEDGEASVMGGATFTGEADGRFRAHTANYGYSWPDLYLMGLATAEEVRPWFYIAGTNPALPTEYWPAEGIVVSGQRRDVSLDQVIAAEGPRNPPAALAQRLFRVLFVLVTEKGQPSAEEVAKINEWRALLEKNFRIATGGRARLTTEWVNVAKKRAVR